ncbi:MAG: MBL fold metallo-hydrolase [Pseudomonadota bacterium]
MEINRRDLLAGLAAALALPASAATPQGMRVVLIGTQGGPNFNALRAETASLVLIGDQMHLVDCGYGALAGLIRADRNYRDVAHVFLTHLHDDHTADLASFMGHQWTGGRVTATDIYGPAGTRRLVAGALQFNRVSEEIRLVDEARSARMADLFHAHEIKAGPAPLVAYRDASLTVSAVENTHYTPESRRKMPHRSLALRFDGQDRSVVFSGDTNYSQNLVKLARNADVLICEAMHVAYTRASFDVRVAAGAYADNPEGVWQHIVAAHTPLDVAGRMAREAGVRTLVLNHIIPGGWNPEIGDDVYRREAAREFAGDIVIGRDLLEI